MEFDIRDLIALSTIPGIGPTRLRSLVNHFKDPAAVARASARQLIAVEGIEHKTALSIVNFFRTPAALRANRYIDDQLSRLNKVNGHALTLWDKTYPSCLKRIYDPPPILFVRGQFAESDNSSIAIVGTRTPTPYGTQVAEHFSTELSKLGITVVSGLARGIDTSAHAASLRSGGRTVGIIGSGVDVMYPPENKRLAERIAEQGAVASEFPMGAKPDAGNFPQRNRVISGLALATLVVETGVDGGAMITATTALDQNRQVFAVPSAVTDKRRSGTNLLIKEGRAMLTETVDDIIQELSPHLKRLLQDSGHIHLQPPPPLTLFEQHVYDALSGEPTHIDALADRAGLTTSDALVHLLSLEFKGAVRQLPGKIFVKT